MKTALPTKSFYYIRHGESEWNVLGKFAGGQVDTPLTNLGKEQAEEARNIFEALSPPPSHIIHSTLSRAADTATILNRNTRYPMASDYNLREVDAGDWEGIPNHEAKKRWASGLHPENGESLEALAQRIQITFTEILSREDYTMPFIAAHGRLLNGIDHLYGIAPRSLQLGNCQILKFIPSKNSRYPWDVYTITLKNGHIHEELAAWSQI